MWAPSNPWSYCERPSSLQDGGSCPQTINIKHKQREQLKKERHSSKFYLFIHLFIYLFREERERAHKVNRGRGSGRETKARADSCWVWSPTRGSISQPWDHDLNGNGELGAPPTEPPKRPPGEGYELCYNVEEPWAYGAKWMDKSWMIPVVLGP